MTDETGTNHRQETDDGENMADVNHEPPEGADTNEVWARGRTVGSADR